MPPPIFVSLEGGEGSGKSTQASILHDRLVKSGHDAILVHEPGSTDLGWYLSRYLKSGKHRSKESELLLFVAARVELENTVIRPKLKQGVCIIADRFADSTVAYQGYGRRIDLEAVHFINSFATGDISPDITFLLDIEPEEGLRRVGKLQIPLELEPRSEPYLSRQEEENQRQFEDQPLAFHKRVRKGYLNLARKGPERWKVIPANGPQEDVSRSIWAKVQPLL